MMNAVDFKWHDLDGSQGLWVGRLPDAVALSSAEFDECWRMHPPQFVEIMMHGRPVLTPRWQQAYGRDYAYSGQVNTALPVPPLLQRLLHWGQRTVDARLNGILVNWYDGSQGHYIGPHRDSIRNMVPGAPIVTISAGEERVFRVKPWKGKGRHDFQAVDRTVIVMPFETNRTWTHEVPKSAERQGRRLSVTLRAFL